MAAAKRHPWRLGILLFAVAGLALALILRSTSGSPDKLEKRTQASAAQFLNSIGVNVHLYYNDTPYRDKDAVLARLSELAVRHVRDGLAPNRPDQVAALRALGAAGIKSDLLVGSPGSDPAPLLDVIRDRLSGSVESIEGPNEYQSSGPGWQDRLLPFQQQLFSAVNDNGAMAQLTVVGASVGGLDLSGSEDVGNIHPYPGGGPPEADIGTEIAKGRVVSGSKPIWATETGYHDAVNMKPGTSQPATSDQAQAVYMPRLFASYFAAGIDRTYTYELLDEFSDPGADKPESRFGLLDHSLQPKPSFEALKRMIGEIGDWKQPEQDPGPPLDIGIDDQGSDLQRLQLTRSDGSIQLLLWRAQPVDSAGAATTPPANVELTLPKPAAIDSLDVTSGKRTDEDTAASHTLKVGPDLQVITLGAGE